MKIFAKIENIFAGIFPIACLVYAAMSVVSGIANISVSDFWYFLNGLLSLLASVVLFALPAVMYFLKKERPFNICVCLIAGYLFVYTLLTFSDNISVLGWADVLPALWSVFSFFSGAAIVYSGVLLLLRYMFGLRLLNGTISFAVFLIGSFAVLAFAVGIIEYIIDGMAAGAYIMLVESLAGSFFTCAIASCFHVKVVSSGSDKAE